MAKKPPLPTSRRRAVQTALALALTVLQDERVRAQLRRAPETARVWAAQRRAADDGEVIDVDGAGASGRLAALDPRRRFGQGAIERRLEALQQNVRLAFPTPSGPEATAVYRAIDELDRAAAISATMPLTKRRRAHARITTELDRLETALVDAVLP